MNKIIQTLTLVADPEISTYGEDKSRATFRGAVAKRFKKEGEPDDFFQYVAFGATADFIGKYFKKGQKMLIEGEIHNNNFEKDGVKHFNVQILVNNVEFFGKKEDGGVAKSTEAKAEAPKKEAAKTETYDEYMDF